MLLKLIKYDLIYSKNNFFALGAALIAAAFVFQFSMTTLRNIALANISASLLLGAVNISVVVLGIIFIHQNYAKNLFSGHGYLMFTLPVKPYLLLVTKMITSLIWLNFMIVVGFVGSMIIVFGIALRDITGYMFPREIGPEVVEAISYLGALVAWAFTHVNVFGFFLVSIFFAIITLSHSYIKNIRIHGVFSTIAGIVYFLIWTVVLGWYHDNAGAGNRLTLGFLPRREWVRDPVSQTFIQGDAIVGSYLVQYDIVLLGSALVFGLAACYAILNLYKRMELR